MKYLIIIGVIVCLLVLYYFYDEITNIKKSFLPTYQKTMELESKIVELDKRTLDMMSRKTISRTDSPPLSITYYSDMVKNGNLSVKYADLSDTEANKILGQINKPSAKMNESSQKKEINNQIATLRDNHNLSKVRKTEIEHGDLSDIIIASESVNKNTNETDSFDVSIGHLIGGRKNIQNDDDIFNGLEKELIEFNNLSKKKKQLSDNEKISESIKNKNIMGNHNIIKKSPESIINEMNSELDSDIIRSISETIQYMDITSDNVISDIPIVSQKKSQKKTSSKNKHKRKQKIDR